MNEYCIVSSDVVVVAMETATMHDVINALRLETYIVPSSNSHTFYLVANV